MGLDPLYAPYKSGTLVPDADFLLFGLVTDAQGALTLAGLWPPGVPAGFTTYHQVWVQDAAGPNGSAASNALKAVAP